MKKLYSLLLVTIFSSFMFAQDPFTRVGEVALPAIENAGFGNIITDLDLDGDGWPEIYAVNNNWADTGAELIPRIYKFEFNGLTWEQVWSATLDIPLQNTWPALTSGDWDKDGKPEVIWGPVNFTGSSNPNPARVVVFEVKGDGSDELGVPDPVNTGNFLPNAKWSIVSVDNFNLRPIKWQLVDIDSDNDLEIVYISRVGSAGVGNRFGVISVSNIPDNGDGSETWTIEAYDTAGVVNSSTIYDMAVIGNTLYIIHQSGDVTPVTFAGGNYTIGTLIPAMVPGGSWLSASVTDIDGDNKEEIVAANWVNASTQKVFLLQETSPGVLTSTEIADFSDLMNGNFNGGDFGDVDNDGKVDFFFGSRGTTAGAAIARLEYQSGAITDPASYQKSIVDQGYSTAGRWMHVRIGELDGDSMKEVLYGEGTGEMAPMIVIDVTGVLPVELTSFAANVTADKVTLNWATATESNNRGFEVERKASDGEFRTIGFIDGKGTTTEAQKYSFVDENVSEMKYTYRLKQIDYDGTFAYSQEVEVDVVLPKSFSLDQNFPNPFNPVTTIRFNIPVESNVTLKIFNTLGEEVATLLNNEMFEAGTHNVSFDASNLPSGTYIYSIQNGEQSFTKKMILMK